MHILVVGGGMQGQVIAKNLIDRQEKPRVTVADIKEPSSLPAGVDFKKLDVLNKDSVSDAMKSADTAVLAVPSQIARPALENILSTGTNVADVCFTPEPPLSLDDLAKKNNASCVVDCGVAPGISHMLVGHAYTELGGLDDVKIFVGGFPQSPPAVFRHAVYFNPEDLISEYVRPARAREDGKAIEPDPLEAKIVVFKDRELGEMQSFLSDGLRTLLTSFPDVPNMSERTLRYTGHLETMANLKELGLFEDDVVAHTASTLGKKYDADSYPDYLLMYVEASKSGKKMCWRLLDKATGGESAMSRTTGYTTAAVAMVLARGDFNEAGVHAPEVLGKSSQLTELILKDLGMHGVKVVEDAVAV